MTAHLDFGLGETVDMLRETAFRFATDRIAPLAAEIDAEAEAQLPVGGDVGVAGDHGALDRDGAGHGRDRAGEFHQHRIAGRPDHAGPVGRQGRQDQFIAMRLERRHGADFVEPHQAAVTDDVAEDDRGQPSFAQRL